LRGQQIAPSAQRQISALLDEKALRTPGERKMDTHLVPAAKVLLGARIHPNFPTPPDIMSAARLDTRNQVEVNIRADVTPDLLAYIATQGGAIVNSFPKQHCPRAVCLYAGGASARRRLS
jgi:hypothetical protein